MDFDMNFTLDAQMHDFMKLNAIQWNYPIYYVSPEK